MMKRRFGIEVEMVGLTPSVAARTIREQAGVEATSEAYNHDVRRHWKVTTDSSVTGARTCEVVSPILEGEEGLEEMKKVLMALEATGADINRSCGFHVHIEARDLTAADIANVVKRYQKYEGEIDAFMPPSRRGSSNSYASSTSRISVPTNPTMDWVRGTSNERYLKVNLQSYVKYGTLEFRHHSGTVSWLKATNWVRFLQVFVEESREAPVAVTAAAAPVVRRLSRSMSQTVSYLSEGLKTADEVARLTGVSVNTAKANISDLRRAGYNVRRVYSSFAGVYKYKIDGQTAAAAPVRRTPVDKPLWEGVPANVRSFYEVRALTLRSQ